jgi:hypothetical protein
MAIEAAGGNGECPDEESDEEGRDPFCTCEVENEIGPD